jgi:long-chain acyl-CoA synthetase
VTELTDVQVRTASGVEPMGRGEPLLVDEPKTLPELFLHATSKIQLDDALNFRRDGEWKTMSTAEMLSRMENIALGLYSLGLRKGDKAGLLAANSPEWTLADAG